MPRRFPTHEDYFVAGTTNTICDATGFKKKWSEVERRWDAFYVIPAAWHPRQPQDFPPRITTQKVFTQARPPLVEESETPVITPI